MQERRRKFYGWGYEDDTVSPGEITEFESAWSRLLGVDSFEALPFPKEEDIALRAPRVQPPAALAAKARAWYLADANYPAWEPDGMGSMYFANVTGVAVGGKNLPPGLNSQWCAI